MTDWACDYFERGYPQRWSLGLPSEGTRREADVIWDRLQLTAETTLLDVGCGHGRHAVVLAQRGASVTGLDFAAHLLARARQLAAELAVSVSWIRGDMRALPIRRSSIQAATVFDAFGFFDEDEENLRVLEEVARVLMPGGRLALKVANAEPIIAGFRAADREARAGTVVEIERTLLTDPPRLIEDLVVSGPRGGGRYQRRQRLYRVADMTAAIDRAGLAVRSVLDGLTGGAFHPESAAAMLIICQSGPD